MNAQQKAAIVRLIENAKGDDLYRARSAFRGQDLDVLYGESGKTKRQILADYELHARELDGLIQVVKETL